VWYVVTFREFDVKGDLFVVGLTFGGFGFGSGGEASP
jgi:hypothetical protein